MRAAVIALALLLAAGAAQAGESDTVPDGTAAPLFLNPPAPTKRRCLRGHWAVPIPILIQRADGAVSVQLDLCPVCILNELQQRAGYPPARK